MSLSIARNRRIEEPQQTEGKSLMCVAHGCPMKWSVEISDLRACSYHAWVDPKKWPSITERLQHGGAWVLGHLREIDTGSYKGHPKAWAMRLKDRHDAGEGLTDVQVKMYREALRMNSLPEAA